MQRCIRWCTTIESSSSRSLLWNWNKEDSWWQFNVMIVQWQKISTMIDRLNILKTTTIFELNLPEQAKHDVEVVWISRLGNSYFKIDNHMMVSIAIMNLIFCIILCVITSNRSLWLVYWMTDLDDNTIIDHLFYCTIFLTTYECSSKS